MEVAGLSTSGSTFILHVIVLVNGFTEPNYELKDSDTLVKVEVIGPFH